MKTFTTLMLISLTALILWGCHSERRSAEPEDTDYVTIAENRDVAILYQIVDSAKNEHDIPEVAIWIKDKASGRREKLYQTVRPDRFSWYMPDGVEFYPVPIDSLLVTSDVYIYNNNPLQLIVEGVPDSRNVFSYFIDVPSRKAWYVPANSGFVGTTSEEQFMIFQSYRYAGYVSDKIFCGRYTYLQIFDYTGVMIDSLDLKHISIRMFSE